MKSINERKNLILARNIYKVFNEFLNKYVDEEILITRIIATNQYVVKIYFFSYNKNFNWNFFWKKNKRFFYSLLMKRLSIKIPKFFFFQDNINPILKT